MCDPLADGGLPGRWPRAGISEPSPQPVPPAGQWSPGGSSKEVLKLREVVVALNEVADARRSEAEALQQQLDLLQSEYAQLNDENERMRQALSNAGTHSPADTAGTLSAAEAQLLRDEIQILRADRDKLDLALRSREEADASAAGEQAASAAEVAAVLESERQQRVQADAELAECRSALAQERRLCAELREELQTQRARPTTQEPQSAARPTTGTGAPVSPRVLMSPKQRRAQWRTEHSHRLSGGVGIKELGTRSAGLTPRRSGGPVWRLAAGAAVVLHAAVLLWALSSFASGMDGPQSVPTAVALAMRGGVRHSALTPDSAASDPLFAATEAALGPQGGTALLGSLVDAGHLVEPARGWRAVAAACTGLDPAFPQPGRLVETAEAMVAAVCWKCTTTAEPESQRSTLVNVLLLFAVELVVLAVLCRIARTRMKKDPPEFEAVPEEEERLRALLPVIRLPKSDTAGGNGITKVWVGDAVPSGVGGSKVEVTVGFADEDRPDPVTDFLYDAVREVLFGRSEDLETFYLHRGMDGLLSAIEFKGTYAGDQTWATTAPQHNTRTVPADELEVGSRGRPVLWVTTWNHLFCERNTNDCDPSVVYEDIAPESYKVLRASRAEVNSTFSGFISSVA